MRVLGRSHHAGGAHPADVELAARLINGAKSPVLLLGMFASAPAAAAELQRLLLLFAMPVVTTFQVGPLLPVPHTRAPARLRPESARPLMSSACGVRGATTSAVSLCPDDRSSRL
jgi:thiamine pyrophosphate-dependent acetolactate synthase large subunit-like protein